MKVQERLSKEHWTEGEKKGGGRYLSEKKNATMQKHSFEGLQRMYLHNFNCFIEAELIG